MGCGAAAGQLDVNDVYQQPLPLLARGEDRLVIACDRKGEKTPRMYKLVKTLAEGMLRGDESFPAKALEMASWGPPAAWELWEESDGLYLYGRSAATQFKKMLVRWSGRPENSFAAQALSSVEVKSKSSQQLEGKDEYCVEHKSLEDDVEQLLGSADSASSEVEIIDIPEKHKGDPTELSTYMITWKTSTERERRTGFVIGCEDELSCNRWMSTLKLYANISWRCCAAHVWKIGQVHRSQFPDNWQEKPEELEFLTDLTCWRRRICFLERLQDSDTLCHTYVSEKFNAESSIAHVLATMSGGAAQATCSITRLPPLTLAKLSPASAQDVSESLLTYTMAVETQSSKYLRTCEEIVLPTCLYAFAVQDFQKSAVNENSVFAFEDLVMRERWLASLHIACEKFAGAGVLNLVKE